MEYEVTYSCGHRGKVCLWTSKDLLESKLRYYRTKGLCPECKRLQQGEKIKREPGDENENTKGN